VITELKPKKSEKKDEPAFEEDKEPAVKLDQAYRALNFENIHKELSDNK
jgi:hypothetical protein